MAKTQINEYSFKPGIGLLDNLYSNAWNLLTKNKAFLLSEYKEYLNAQIANASTNRRDVTTVIDGVGFDIALNTNYNAIFYKNSRNYVLETSSTLSRTLTRVQTKILDLSNVKSSTTAKTRINSYFTTVQDIFTTGKDDDDSVVFTNPSSAPTVNIAAKDKLLANKNFIAEEVNAYVVLNNANDLHDSTGCKRDIKFLVNALAYDVLYGGASGVNSATFDQAKYFLYNFDTGTSSISPQNRVAAVAAFARFQTIVDDIVKGVTITPTAGHSVTQDITGNNTSEVISQYLVTLAGYTKDIVAATSLNAATTALNNITRTSPTVSLWANSELQNAKTDIDNNKTNILDTTTWLATYTYSNTNIQNKVDKTIDALTFNLRYGGNESLIEVLNTYWENTVSQILGNRVPEMDVYSWIGETIKDNIFSNTSYENIGTVSQVLDTNFTAESAASTRITTLVQNIIDTIQNGLASLPTLEKDGVGSITFAKNLNIHDFLIITNLSSNTVIYNFTNNTIGGTVVKSTPLQYSNFPNFVEKSDTITKLRLNIDTSNQSESDELQIFIENSVNNESILFTKAAGIGNDGANKTRISEANTVFNADFEYGIDQNKWQNFSMQRGYPAVYEISNIPLDIASITTDVSINTNNIGGSLIVVTTKTPHGMSVGDPITVSNLSHLITATDSAEGTFSVHAVTSNTKFSYYAKNKVGNDTESANADNYSSDFTVISDTGFLYVANQTQWSRSITAGTPTIYNSIIRFNGVIIVNTNDDTFFQQGFYQTGNDRYLFGAVSGGAFETTVYQLKKQVIHSYLNIAIPQTVVKKANYFTNSEIEDGLFSIDTAGSTSTSTTSLIIPSGSRHFPFTGTSPSLGAPANVYYASSQTSGTVSTTDGSATIITTDTSSFSVGALVTGAGIPVNTLVNTIGTTGPNFNIVLNKNATATASSISVTITAQTQIGQVTSLQTSGTTGGIVVTPSLSKDASVGEKTIEVVSTTNIVPHLAIDRGNGTATFVEKVEGNKIHLLDSLTSNLIGNNVIYDNIQGINVQHNGFNASFDVSATGSNYAVAINTAGQNYIVGDRLKISGTSIGGLSITNDLKILVNTVDGSGGITSITPSGTPFDGNTTITNVSGTVSGGVGTNAVFAFTYVDNQYTSITITSGGSGYVANDKILIAGTNFIDGTSQNDCILTVNSVDGNGSITQITGTGTAPNGNATFSNPTFTTSGSGTISAYTVQNVAGSYTVTITTSNNFLIGDSIQILGSMLGGADTTNNLTLIVSTVSSTGSILTFTVSGTGINGTFKNSIVGTNLQGLNSKFNVTLNNGSYTNIIINNNGSNFAVGQIIKILGSALMGQSPGNDLLLTVTAVDSNRMLSTVAVQSGTAATTITPYSNVLIYNDDVIGTGAKFAVTRNATTYTLNATRSGKNYAIGNRIKILGTQLGGVSPSNDLEIKINSVGTNGELSLNTSTIFTLTFTGVPTGSTVNLLSTFTLTTPLSVELATDTTVNFDQLSIMQVTTTGPHGLLPGNSVLAVVDSDTSSNNHKLASGTFSIHNVPDKNTFKYFVRASGVINESLTFPTSTATKYNTNTDFYKETTITIDGSSTTQISIKYDNVLILQINQLQNTSQYNSIVNAGNQYTLGQFTYKRGTLQVSSASENEYQIQKIQTVKTFGDRVTGKIVPQSSAFFNHDPHLGSYQLSTGNVEHGAQAIQQTKQYFRYQFGNSVFYNTAINFSHTISIQNIIAEGTGIDSIIKITIDSKMHGLQKNAVVRILGVSEEGYNSGPNAGAENVGDYVVYRIIDDHTFEIKAIKNLSTTTPTTATDSKIAVINWQGTAVKAGVYDDQNGVFWEYDGKTLYAVLRTSTEKITGTISVNKDSHVITGVNTKFTDQLIVSDRVVINGMTYIVTSVSNDTEFTIAADYRGYQDQKAIKITKIVDTKIPQTEFNIDKLDGVGSSNYLFDVSRMQMVGLQYTWQGAGHIDFLIKGIDGEWIFAHKMRTINQNTKIYMRTANLPVRIESSNETAKSSLKSNITASSTSIILNDSSQFPDTGTICIDNELIAFNSNTKTTNTLGDCVRAAKLTCYNSSAIRSYTGSSAASHTAKTGVILISQTAQPIVNNWSSSYQIDGKYNTDSEKVFAYTIKNTEITNQENTNLMLRLAPSASNNSIGDIGEQELLNHKQLKLDSIEVQVKDLHPTQKVITGTITATNSNGNITASVAHNLSINMPIKFSGVSPSTTSMGGIQADGTLYYVKRIVNSTEFRLGASATASTEITLTTDTTDFINFETVPDLPGSIVIEGILNPTNYPINKKVYWNNIYNTNNGGQLSFSQIALGKSTDFSQGLAASTTPSATVAADVITTGAGNAGFVYTAVDSAKSRSFAIANSEILSLGPIPLGARITSTDPSAFSSSTGQEYIVTKITSDSDNTFIHYESTVGSTRTTGQISHTTTPKTTFKFEYFNNTGKKTNKLLFTKSSWDSSGAQIGTRISPTDNNWSSGTKIISVKLLNLKNIEFYEVVFNQDSIKNISTSDTVTFQLGETNYATGGETIFQGTTVPGDKQKINLSTCNSLSNTPIGGNKTYPDGPDTLVINTTKLVGEPVFANITLRWSEF